MGPFRLSRWRTRGHAREERLRDLTGWATTQHSANEEARCDAETVGGEFVGRPTSTQYAKIRKEVVEER